MPLWLTPEEVKKREALHRRVHTLLETSKSSPGSSHVRKTTVQSTADTKAKAEPSRQANIKHGVQLEAKLSQKNESRKKADIDATEVTNKEAEHAFQQWRKESADFKNSYERDMRHMATASGRSANNYGIRPQQDAETRSANEADCTTGQPSEQVMRLSHNPKRKVDLSGMTDLFKKPAMPSITPSKRLVNDFDKTVLSPASVGMPLWWYRAIKPSAKKRLLAKERIALDLFADFKNAKNHFTKTSHGVAELRGALQKLERINVTAELLIHSKIMEAQNLPQLLPGGSQLANLPFDIQADAKTLHIRWFKGDFDCHILRGIKISRVPSLDQSWPHGSSAKFFGEGHLVNGQWWPSQLCALRDGAHGASVAGIFGHEGLAVSIVVAHSKYADVDNGDVLDYCGTEGKGENNPSSDTQLMINSCRKKQPVRVLRSSSLNHKYAPSHGFRYDGLYKVAQYKIIDPSKSYYLFFLERLPNQHPIRCTGDETRPTVTEVQDYQNHKLRMKGII